MNGNQMSVTIPAQKQAEIEAAVLRRLLAHFEARSDVQNIDLMNLAGFCRNCLSRWYAEAAQEAGYRLDSDAARERIYGMPYQEWKEKHQRPVSTEKLQAFDNIKPGK
ncbi:MAG: DUF1244 domain-containing protein [Pseudomonadales bacterium]